MNGILSLLIILIGSFAVYIKNMWLDKNIFSTDPKDLINNIFFWGMFSIFVLVSLRRILKDNRILKEIKKMESELKNMNSDNIMECYEEIKENFLDKKKYRFLSENWRSFRNTLFIKNNHSIYQIEDAEIYFNSVNLMKEKMNFKLLNYIPQLLLGIGMIGTFLGLSIGLADLNLTSDDKNQLTTLILGTKTAFYTSLYGMYFSICMSIILNGHLGAYEASILRLKDKINNIFKRYKRDQSIEEIKDELIALRKSNEELSKNISIELVKGMKDYNEINKEHLANMSELVATNISGLGDEVTKSFEVKMEKIFSKDFIKPFEALKTTLVEATKANNNEITQYAQSLKEATKEIKQIKTIMEKVSEKANKNFHGVLDRLENKYKEVIEILENNTETYEKYQILLENSKDIILSSNEYVTKLENIGNIFQKFTSKEESLTNFWNNNKNIMEEFSKRITDNYRMWEERYENQEIKLNEYYEKHLKALFDEYDSQLTKAIISFKDMIEVFVERSMEVSGNIEQSNNLIEKTENTARVKYENEAKNILDEMSKMSEKLKLLMEAIGEATVSKEEIFKEISSKDEMLIEFWNKNKNTLDEFEDKIAQGTKVFVNTMNSFMEEAGNANIQLKNREIFGDILTKLKKLETEAEVLKHISVDKLELKG